MTSRMVYVSPMTSPSVRHEVDDRYSPKGEGQTIISQMGRMDVCMDGCTHVQLGATLRPTSRPL